MMKMTSSGISAGGVLTGLVAAALLMAAIPFVGPADAWAHGGKTHAADAFTPLKALEKATRLYDTLIAEGKLDDGWEVELVKAEISVVVRAGKKETVVSFHRGTGDPSTVFFFFSAGGEYAGSNFTGQ
jgi:hypothetical protein